MLCVQLQSRTSPSSLCQGKETKIWFFPTLIAFALLEFFCSILSVLAFADPPYNFCSNTTIGSPVQYNLNNLFLSLHSNASVSKFYYTSIGIGPDRLFGLYMCLNYVTNGSCQDCIRMASTDLTKLCPEAREAVMWEELCEVRYSYKDFYGQYMLNVTGNLFTEINMMNILEPEQYVGNLTKIPTCEKQNK